MPSWTPRPRISFVSGSLAQPQIDAESHGGAQLVVIDTDGPALISRGTAAQLGLAADATCALLQLASGSDCVLAVSVVDGEAEGGAGHVSDGQVAITAVQQYNLHLSVGMLEDFRLFVPPAGVPFELVDVEGEVTLLGGTEGSTEEAVQVDVRALTRELLRLCFRAVLAVNEVLVLAVGGRQLLLRITATNTLDAEAQDEGVAYHCYRGLLTQDTQIYLHSPGTQQASAAAAAPEDGGRQQQHAENAAAAELLPQSLAAARAGVVLLNARQRPPAGFSRSSVKVVTNDGEWFPVKRVLLRPCIALTTALRAEQAGLSEAEVPVDVDTLTFDRVLLFLEALALGQEPPSFGLHLCPPLLAAARWLGLRPLEEHCQERLGESSSRLRFYSFDEVRQLNAAGGCWLILDGMVLDVTCWLPEHPGGSKIIPRQALNLDCSRMFELYHASRESFVFLRQFYFGEIAPEDRDLVPAPDEPPSSEFLQQLHDFTPWRLQVEVATHLGSRHAAARASKRT
ncbi:hypothetical protein D9Q98_003599 [Chlorella vulgaris]|uniref:Cytochrome b5 heme-binding domain-containing protein n=1 Tax=Chlorella vulgaris TaxID=3077 RepID=A0A9D4TTE3_CHLVU|nr:hypothetical protein D9Q98_003599 [Chlorella vulgaris]